MKRERGGWKTDRADLHPPDDLVLQPLVVDLDVVVAGVVALGVEVHVDVDPLAEQAARPDGHLVVEARGLEAAPTAGVRVQRQRRACSVPSRDRSVRISSRAWPSEGQVGVLRRGARATFFRRRLRLLLGRRAADRRSRRDFGAAKRELRDRHGRRPASAATTLSNAASAEAGRQTRRHPSRRLGARLVAARASGGCSKRTRTPSVRSYPLARQSTRGSQIRQPRATRRRVTLEDHDEA